MVRSLWEGTFPCIQEARDIWSRRQIGLGMWIQQAEQVGKGWGGLEKGCWALHSLSQALPSQTDWDLWEGLRKS